MIICILVAMKKILAVSLFTLVALAANAQRQTIAKCFLSVEPPAGWFKKEVDDSKAPGTYTCTYTADTVTSRPAIGFFPPLNLKTTLLDSTVVDAKTLCAFFAREYPSMAPGYVQIGNIEEVLLDNRKLYKLEYTIPKDGKVGHLVSYFYDNGMYSVSIISLVDNEDTYKSNLRAFNAAIGSIKFM